MKKTSYIVLALVTTVLTTISPKIQADDENVKACSSVLPFLCQTPDCTDNKAVKQLCDGKISFAEAGTECMTPRLPMVKCTRATDSTPSVKPTGGPGVWYITQKGGKLQVIKTADELRALFAPITSPKTALGLALLLTHDFPLFASPYPSLNNGWCSSPEDPGQWVDRIAAFSQIDKVDKGFQIRLFKIDQDRLLAQTYTVDGGGNLLDPNTAKNALWTCGSSKKKK